MAKSQEAVTGLRFTLPGAPATWHTIPELAGYYHPEAPSPIGGPGEPTEEQARAASEDEGCHVDLVQMTDLEAQHRRQAIAEFRGEAVPTVAALRREVGGHEATVAADELASATPKED